MTTTKLHPIYGRRKTPEEARIVDWLKSRFDALDIELKALPASRELSLARTQLEQASMWATKAVLAAGDSCHEKGIELASVFENARRPVQVSGVPDGGPWPHLTEGWPHAREYRKTATVWAVQMNEAFEVDTKEGRMRGNPGDYLCQGPAGERWPIKKDIFEATYVPVARPPEIGRPLDAARDVVSDLPR